MTQFISKVIPTNDTKYSSYIKAVETVEPIIIGSISCHLLSLALGICKHTNKHMNKNNYKKPGVHWFKNRGCLLRISIGNKEKLFGI